MSFLGGFDDDYLERGHPGLWQQFRDQEEGLDRAESIILAAASETLVPSRTREIENHMKVMQKQQMAQGWTWTSECQSRLDLLRNGKEKLQSLHA